MHGVTLMALLVLDKCSGNVAEGLTRATGGKKLVRGLFFRHVVSNR